MERRLYRSKHNRVLLGICGGMGEYFNIDPVIIRVIAIVLLIIGVFPAIIAYLILALIIPLEGSTYSTPGDNIRENINDLKDTGVGMGEEIRTAFQKTEEKSEGTQQPEPGTPHPSYTNTNRALWIVGLVIIAIGIFVLLNNFFGWLWRFLWPVALIAVGLLIIVLVTRRR
jgi:phage shock protein C